MAIYTVEGGSVLEIYKKWQDKVAVEVNAEGKAHCALLVRQITGAPQTSSWKKGIQVKGGNVTPGTAIATFEKVGDEYKYTGKSGVCHAAIFVRETTTGIEVWDQWASGHMGQRKLDGYRHGIRELGWHSKEKSSPKYIQSNDGEAMYVIKT